MYTRREGDSRGPCPASDLPAASSTGSPTGRLQAPSPLLRPQAKTLLCSSFIYVFLKGKKGGPRFAASQVQAVLLLWDIRPYPSLWQSRKCAPGRFQGGESQLFSTLQGPGMKSMWGEAELMEALEGVKWGS